MDIKNRKILILGGWGLVGMAILRKLVVHDPKEIIILSLREEEAKDACAEIQKEALKVKLTPAWGNIFVRSSLKDLPRNEILDISENRRILLEDVLEAFNDEKLDASFLNQLIVTHQPDIIIDSVNSATGLAYQDIYNGYYNLKQELNHARQENALTDNLTTEVEKMLTTLYIPQIIRHIQILHTSMVNNKTGVYIKIGTTGTGGMGLNIPYTHSEEKPSRVLLSKTSLAGAHTMLLFLMGRTPEGPIIKEVKPAAAIDWKRIGYGTIHKQGKPIRLYDCKVENAETLGEKWNFEGDARWSDNGVNMQSVFIDTGENGTFSLPEFETITSAGQMEFVTPEEIASNTIMEIIGDSTGHDIINGLDNSIMNPTYRAGYMRHDAMEQMQYLQDKHDVESIAFEILGPPRLSKILYEAALLKKIGKNMRSIVSDSVENLIEKAESEISNNKVLRSQMISIGLPILLADGKRLIRGPQVKIPTQLGRKSIDINSIEMNSWADAGWIDLRRENIISWQDRFKKILSEYDALPDDETSSRYHHGRKYWAIDEPLQIGKIASWIFINEDKGLRIKR